MPFPQKKGNKIVPVEDETKDHEKKISEHPKKEPGKQPAQIKSASKSGGFTDSLENFSTFEDELKDEEKKTYHDLIANSAEQPSVTTPSTSSNSFTAAPPPVDRDTKPVKPPSVDYDTPPVDRDTKPLKPSPARSTSIKYGTARTHWLNTTLTFSNNLSERERKNLGEGKAVAQKT